MDYGLMVCRAMHFGASLIAFGILLFQSAIAPKDLAAALDRRLGRIVLRSVVLAAATSVLWLAATTATMGDGWQDAVSPAMLRTVLLDTEFGRVWQWHMGLSVALAAIVCWRRQRPDSLRSPMTGAISACQLGTLGLVGHAVMLSGPLGIANQASLALHLLAAGFWLGSLVPVILCLRIGADDPLRREAMAALTRFSNIGHVSVVLVVATGIVNIALIEGLSLNLGTPYRQLLAVKVAIVATMVALAIVNRYWLVPRLRRDAAALDRIRRICVIVFYLGLAAVGLVSVFGMLSPS